MFRFGTARLDHRAPTGILLHARDNAIHDVDRLVRVLAGGGFARQHHRVSAIEHRRRHVGGLGARGCRRADHALQHLRRDDHRLAQLTRGANDALLRQRHFLRRQFHAEIAPRHHHRIGKRHDGVEILQRLRLLQLHHRPGATTDQLLRLRHVFGPLHERQSDVVRAMLQREFQVDEILRRQRRYRQHDVRHIDALVVGKRAADHHLGDQRISALMHNAQPQFAIVQQQRAANGRGLNDLRMRQVDPRSARPVSG